MYTLIYDDGVSIDGEETTVSPFTTTPKPNQDDDDNSDCGALPSLQALENSADGSAPASASTIDEDRSIRIHNKMLINTRVYAISDKFNVLDLKPLAQAQFNKARSLGSWPYHRFSTIVAEILRSTPASDKGLREIALGLCSEHMLELLDDTTTSDTKLDQWAMILKDDVTFLFDVLRAGSRAHTKKNVQQEELQAKLRKELRELQALSNTKTTALNGLLSTLRTIACPACRGGFQPVVTRVPDGERFQVSCRKCHYSFR